MHCFYHLPIYNKKNFLTTSTFNRPYGNQGPQQDLKKTFFEWSGTKGACGVKKNFNFYFILAFEVIINLS